MYDESENENSEYFHPLKYTEKVSISIVNYSMVFLLYKSLTMVTVFSTKAPNFQTVIIKLKKKAIPRVEWSKYMVGMFAVAKMAAVAAVVEQ